MFIVEINMSMFLFCSETCEENVAEMRIYILIFIVHVHIYIHNFIIFFDSLSM